MRNGVQLITYADRLGMGDLATIRGLLSGSLAGAFTGAHILPFFTPFDGADAGFDPVDHLAVDPRLGDWSSIAAIAATGDVTADLIVNHISVESSQFKDFLARGDDSPHAEMFLETGDVFPGGITEQDLGRIYRPRPTEPFTEMTLADGSRRRMWTTFTPQQVDLNVGSPRAREYLSEVLGLLAGAGVTQVRVDAAGYAVKTAGTSCFMTPETLMFIEELCVEIRRLGMSPLLEIHSHHEDQIAAAALSGRVYDFALPPLVLHTLHSGDARTLRRWLKKAPRNAVTVLDTHDGIGIVDVGPDETRPGLLTPDQIDDLIEAIHGASGGQSRLATGQAASNLDLYQVNCTYFSALGGDEDLYLTARLIQFLSPGAPQVYYAGLLAAENDMELLAETGVGRDINRPYFGAAQVAERLEAPVVRRLLAMARWRNEHPAFDGRFRLGGGGDSELHMAWRSPAGLVEARFDLAAGTFAVDSDGTEIADWDQF